MSALTIATAGWSLRMPAGTLQQWLSTFTQALPGSTIPWPIDGSTWEYVVRSTATDTGSPLISITTTPSSQGVLTVAATASVSSVEMTLNPAATASLVPATYFHSLWQDPSTASAFSWWSGLLMIDGNPQP